jgi:anaerobic magnesium-protoporphyrin IX monomethyl ester cyclase
VKVVFYHEMIESLGLEYLSAALRARGHDTELVFNPKLFDNHAITFPRLERHLGLDLEHVLARLERSRPDLVGFSANVATYRGVRAVATALRRRLRVPTVVGGPLATSLPEQFLGEGVFDYVVVGEGEAALVELADALAAGTDPAGIPNLWLRRGGREVRTPPRPFVTELDALPDPDRDLFAREGHVFGMITATRGCPFRCTFCAAGSVLQEAAANPGKWYRRRAPAAVVAEAARARDRYGTPMFHFGDDVFPLQLDWLREFAAGWQRDVAIPFDINVAPTRLRDEVVELLRAAGCVQVSIGLQSTNSAVSRDIMNRKFNPEHVAAMVRAFVAHGIVPLVDVMFGVPGETADQMMETARWSLAELGGASLHTFVYMPLPGTPLERVAISAHLLDEEWWRRMHDAKQNEYGETLIAGPDAHVARNLAILLPLLDMAPPWLRRSVELATERRATPLIRLLSLAALSKLDRFARISYLESYGGQLPVVMAQRVATLLGRSAGARR